KQPGALAVQLDLYIEPAEDIHNFGGGDVGFGEERILFDCEFDRAGTVNGNFGCVSYGVRRGFEVDAECGEQFFLFGFLVVFVGAAAAEHRGSKRERQIDVESAQASNHSISHQIGMPSQSKEL